MEIKNVEKFLKAEEVYYNSDISLTNVCKQFEICQTTFKRYLIKKGKTIKNSFDRNPSYLDLAVKELTKDNIDEVSKKYGICKKALNEFLINKRNIARKNVLQYAIDEYKETYIYTRKLNRISEKYGINEKTLSKYIKKENIEIITNSTRKYIVDDVFEKIDTEEKAYWLGFLFADGYVGTNDNSVGLGLAIKDIEHVEKFKRFILSDCKIDIYSTHYPFKKTHFTSYGRELFMASLHVSNKKMREDLIKCGCVPKKSLILEFPDESIFNYDKQLIYAFIRGYLDGDGSIGSYICKNGYKHESISLIGTYQFLNKVQEYLCVKGCLSWKSNCCDKTYILKYSNEKARFVADLIYDNASVYLDRKYKIYSTYYHPKIEQKR